MIRAVKTPYRDPIPFGVFVCGRCGIRCTRRRASEWLGYCVDCKAYAKADGLLEPHGNTRSVAA